MELHHKISGVLLIILAAAHIIFPRYFRWEQELGALSLINRQMMYIHTFFIALVVFLIGLLSLTSSYELTKTAFGRFISLGIGIFWAARLLIQFFGYSPELWKGKTFETVAHIIFSLFWTYLSSVFLMAYFL